MRAAGAGSAQPKSTSTSRFNERCWSGPDSGRGPSRRRRRRSRSSRLADTAGAEPVDLVLQRRDRPDAATYIGSGKAEELHTVAEALDIDVVVLDGELSPAQQRNLEKLLERDVVDRVALILDIFAQHATSQEGMVQVELAQLRYLLPRLAAVGPSSASKPVALGHVDRVKRSSRSIGVAFSGASPSSSRT